ncbi:MAG: hypothetical protein M3Y58_23575 [Chloroflexota bacterium]|nr:hypothetical protein [Chloroflexota bacterium]
MTEKQCRTCERWKNVETEFGRRPTHSGPFPFAECKRCRQNALNARYQTDPLYREACKRANRESAARRRQAAKGKG